MEKYTKIQSLMDKLSILITIILLFFIVNKMAYTNQLPWSFYISKKIGFFYWIGWGYFLISSLTIKYIYEVKLKKSPDSNFFLRRYLTYRNISILFAFFLIISII